MKRILSLVLAFALASSARAAALAPGLFNRRSAVTVSGYAGSETLTSFPVLVALAADSPSGFNYADCAAGGADLRFADEDGNLAPHEIESWNTAGTSYVWVRVPRLAGRTTGLEMYYGADPATLPAVDPSDVWDRYAVVIHGGDSLANAIADGPAVTAGSASVAAGADAGVAGGGIRKSANNAAGVNVANPSAKLADSGRFSVSGWFKRDGNGGNQGNGTHVLAASRSDWSNEDGFLVLQEQGKYISVSSRGAHNWSSGGNALADRTWGHVAFAYDKTGSTLVSYFNGAQDNRKTSGVGNLVNTSGPWTFGSYANRASSDSFKGEMDELRVFDGVASADWIKAEYDSVVDPASFAVPGAVEATDPAAQAFAVPTVVRNANGTFTVTVVLTANRGAVGVIYDAGTHAVTNLLAASAGPGTYTDTPANLTVGTTYRFAAYGKNANGTEVVKKGGVFHYGNLSVAKISDANENGLVPGAFRISRADTAHDLPVAYTVGGTAIAGQTYEALSGAATIPAGANSVDIAVVPLIDAQTTSDTTVSVVLAATLYDIDVGSAELTVVNLAAPSGYNTWIAAADGLASVGSNWSAGHCPAASEAVLFDGRFSTANCQWDATASGTVASWTQNANYTGTVQIDTTYDATFPALNVAGDVAILGGNWTHRINEAADGQKYRLKAIVGGDFTLASGCKLDAEKKGYWAQKYPAGSTYSAHAASGDGFDKIYGNVYRPADLGAGSYASGTATDNKSGGGAVWLEIVGAATLNGTINVRGRQFDGSNTACGSVYVKAKSCSGSGSILANFSAGSYYNGNRGAGGRVAIELTEATELAFPTANVKINGINAGGSGGGGGTFYVKTADPDRPNGVLYLDDQRGKTYGARWHTPKSITAIPAGETWTFDAIVIRNYGMLAVPPGTTLNLPNGPMSVSATSTRQGGIRYDGGTINWGSAPYEFASNWIFQANAPYTFDGDVVVHGGGAIGCMQYRGNTDFSDSTQCDITVNGNLTVESGGYLYANGGGPDMNINRDVVSFHGGQSAGASGNKAYDSVFHPRLPGYGTANGDQATSAPGGGLLRIDVNGEFVNNGTVTANGSKNDNAGSAGGSLVIAAKTLSGTGTFSADTASGSNGSGGGGRIAVRLTGGRFAEGAAARFSAKGATVVKNGESSDRSSSAGTVYLQDGGEGCGTVYVRNDGNALNVNTYTPLPAGVTKAGVAPDAAADFKRASLVVGDCGRVKLYADLKMVELDLEADTALDLNGHALVVRTAHAGGTNIEPGTYAAGSAVPIGAGTLGDYLLDTADGAGGALRVLGAATILILR